ncbi:energy transducer TonB [Humitalea sp. 24SJ18S-53]|uniref:energy transducer TonB n=1 Tax=Humitalea sp. 24SJ18S-53 TaxID=3422307 RepID=UPI003D667705
MLPRRRRRDVKPFGPAAIASALLHVMLLLAWLIPDLGRDMAEPLPPPAIEVVFEGGQPDRPAQPPPQPPSPPEPESPEPAPPPDAPPPPVAPPEPAPSLPTPPPPPPPTVRPPPPAAPAAPPPVARPPEPAPPPPAPPAPIAPPAPPAAVGTAPPPPSATPPAPPQPTVTPPEPPPPLPVRPEAPPIEFSLPPAEEFTLPPPTPLTLPPRPRPPPPPREAPRAQPRPDPNAPIYLPDGFSFERARPPSQAARPPGRQLDTSVSPEQLGRMTPDPQLQVRGAQVGPDWRNAFRAWLDANLRYPEDARQNGAQGNVRVRITADPDGTVRSVRLLRSSNSLWLDRGTERPFRPGVRIPPFPPGADPRGVEVDLEVQYRLIQR